MSWANELQEIRALLRDPDGLIWSDALLLSLYNDVQQTVQRETGILEAIAIQRVPPNYQCSYHHDWEWNYLPSGTKFFQCLTEHDAKRICHYWETQVNL